MTARLPLAVLLLFVAVSHFRLSSAARLLLQDTTTSNSTASTSSSSSSSDVFKGEGTAYSDSVANGSGFACSFRFLNPWAKTFFAAMNAEQWEDGQACGKCVSAKCIDDRCTKHDPVTLYIVDKCPECAKGDLDLSIPAYNEVTGLWPHRLQFQWTWTDCPADEFKDSIRLDPKDGINAFWSAFYFSNARFPLAKVKIDGAELKRQTFNFWVNPNPLGEGPHELELEAINGQTLSTKVNDMLKSQDLGIQF